VARAADVPLEVDRRIAEPGLRLGARGAELRPPPPADALMMMGKPMRSTASKACSSLSMTPVPGKIGTPASAITLRAETLSPMRRMISGCGPIQCRPHFCTTPAKCAFSARKPYPGCTASARDTSAALMMAGIDR
jgi:hypothetical protein